MSLFQGVGDGLLDQLLAKRLLTPGGSVAPAVQPELVGAIILEDDRPENWFLASQRIFGRTASVAAGGAGTRSSLQLVNTSNNTVVTVERVISSVAAGQNVQVRLFKYALGVLPFGTVTRGLPRDTRIDQTGTLALNSQAAIVTDNTLAAVGITVWSQSVSMDIVQPFVLGPGGALVICPAADNIALGDTNIFWRERPLNPSERI